MSDEAPPVHRLGRYLPVVHPLLHCAQRMSLVEFGGDSMYWFVLQTVPPQALHAAALIAPYPPLKVAGGQAVDDIPPMQ